TNDTRLTRGGPAFRCPPGVERHRAPPPGKAVLDDLRFHRTLLCGCPSRSEPQCERNRTDPSPQDRFSCVLTPPSDAKRNPALGNRRSCDRSCVAAIRESGTAVEQGAIPATLSPDHGFAASSAIGN